MAAKKKQAKADDVEIVVVTPSFERTDGITPAPPPADRAGFGALKHRAPIELRAMGLSPWSLARGRVVWLFPAEWFAAIPEAFIVTTINGEQKSFRRRSMSDDRRLGMLAFGIERVETNQ